MQWRKMDSYSRQWGESTRGTGFQTPAIVLRSLWPGVLVLTGTFDQLVEYTGFAVVLFSGSR